MRTLVLLRGAPGCGKSTWIRDNKLERYAISADDLRMMYASPRLQPDGSIAISQREDKDVWNTLFGILEHRMKNGDFTVVDACNSKTSEMTRYRDLAREYRYRIYCVDFTGIPIEEAKRRNKLRDPLKWVPNEYIDRVYSRFETQKIPSGITRVLPEDFEKIYMTPIDMSQYKAVIHIGDIHGCYDKLMEALPNGIEDDKAYIFLGDYCDRGPDSAKVVEYLLSIYEKPNVCLLEGNHEHHLWAWANDRTSQSREFEFRTRPQLERAGIDKKAVRELYRRMRQCSWYTFHGDQVLCTHAGLSSYYNVGQIDFVPTIQMIYGVGAYEDVVKCAESFDCMLRFTWQVFGHRNIVGEMNTVLSSTGRCMEGAVERGGELRTCALRWDDQYNMVGIEYNAYPNPLPDQPEVEEVQSDDKVLIHDLIDKMRSSKLIQEKKFGHISSFNFTRKAFADKKWNDLTTKARGLFIDTTNYKILARGYDKFFAIGEREETRLQSLENKIALPVDIYIKSNGFLGMVSYDRATSQLFITTKSSPDGAMADLFRSRITDQQKSVMEEYLKEHDVTLLFEVIAPQDDPHIIEYPHPDIVLLDIVTNTLDPQYAPHDELAALALSLNCMLKGNYIPAKAYTIAGFKAIVDEVSNTDMRYEGVVFRDANGLMLKLKTPFYTQWKKLRNVAHSTLKEGYLRQTSVLATPMENYFYAFVKDIYERIRNGETIATDIISLRKMFFEAHPEFDDKEEEN